MRLFIWVVTQRSPLQHEPYLPQIPHSLQSNKLGLNSAPTANMALIQGKSL